jgi:hypothetical protein
LRPFRGDIRDTNHVIDLQPFARGTFTKGS